MGAFRDHVCAVQCFVLTVCTSPKASAHIAIFFCIDLRASKGSIHPWYSLKPLHYFTFTPESGTENENAPTTA